MQPINRNRTRRSSPSPNEQTDTTPGYALNTGLEKFLNLNTSEAYKRPWHRLERGLRLNRIRKFIEAETARMNLAQADVEHLTNLLHIALDKKLLNSKTCVVYDHEKEEIQEIKGLVYHKAADGRIISQIIEKKSAITLRRKSAKPTDGTQTQQNMNQDAPQIPSPSNPTS